MLSLLLIISPMTAMAEVGGNASPVFSDMPEDWSTEALQHAIDNGLLTGFDGKIMPKDNLTRAQMATIINRAFGATEKASLEMFADVKPGAWFYDEMAKAIQMKTFKGDGNKLNPNAQITRAEAFVVIARALKLESTDVAPTGFNDLANIPEWAKGELYALINSGYVAGSNGSINPKNNITRAEFAKVMDNIFKVYVKEAAEYTTLENGNVIVNVPGVTLKDLTISGDLIVADGVGDGNLILDNVNISGRMVVRGGGENSIIIKGTSKVSNLIIARVDGAVRIVTEEGAVVEVINIDDGQDKVIIEGAIGQLDIVADVPVVLANASVDSVTVSAPNAQLTVNQGSKVESLVVSEVSQGSTISVAGSVTTVSVEAPKATIEGSGEVKEVVVAATSSDTSITTPSTKITTEEGATNITGTGGVVIPEGTTANNNQDTSKPAAVVEEPKTSTGGDRDGSTPLRLESAWLGGVKQAVNGNEITVNFTLGTIPGKIEAVFNKSVTITGVSSNKVSGTLTKVEETIENSLPSTSSTLTLSISKVITQAHLDTFGDVVYVSVRDNDGQTETFTIYINK